MKHELVTAVTTKRITSKWKTMEDKKFTDSSSDTVTLKPQNSADISFGAGVIFLAGVTFASILGGLGLTLGKARRKSPDAFGKRHEEATLLALKALGWGTVYAVSGVGLLVLGVKSALGVKDAKEFGTKMKSVLPSQDGKLVTYFESWQLPRNHGKPDLWTDTWFSSTSKREASDREETLMEK